MVRLTDRPDMTLDVYRGRKTTIHRINKKNCLRQRLQRFSNAQDCICAIETVSQSGHRVYSTNRVRCDRKLSVKVIFLPI